MHDFLCWLGIHTWNWFITPRNYRVCKNCGMTEKWINGKDGYEWCWTERKNTNGST